MNNAGALLERGVEMCARHRCAEAVDLLETAAGLDPQNPLVHFELGFCYSGGCGMRPLPEPERAIEHLGAALQQSEDSASPLLRARILSALGNAYRSATHLPATTRLLSAIDCCRRAAALYRKQFKEEDRTREMFNEANAWCDLPEDEFPGKWERAVALYEQALAYRTRRRNPERFAATMHNLGTAYRELKSGDRVRNIAKAVACYHDALRARTPCDDSLKLAALQNNLGNAFVSLAEMDGPRAAKHALRALCHFDRALRAYTRSAHPCNYAVAQFNRGHAFLLALAAGAEVDLEQAAICFHEAEECFALCGREEYRKIARQRFDQLRPLLFHRQAGLV